MGRACVGMSVLHPLRAITLIADQKMLVSLQREAISRLVALAGRHETSANFQYEESNAKVQSAREWRAANVSVGKRMALSSNGGL
jgi:hypothetical protein